MATHEFGIMDRPPVHGDRYDCCEPEKYCMISVDDAFIEPLLPELDCLDFFWHSLDVPRKGLAYCGVTLIPPQSMGGVIDILKGIPALFDLKKLLLEAKGKNKFIIHYGL